MALTPPWAFVGSASLVSQPLTDLTGLLMLENIKVPSGVRCGKFDHLCAVSRLCSVWAGVAQCCLAGAEPKAPSARCASEGTQWALFSFPRPACEL